MSRRLLSLLALAGLAGLGLLLILDGCGSDTSEGGSEAPAMCQGGDGECRWSVQRAVTPGKAGVLVDVSCPAPDLCVAVGNEYHGGGLAQVRTGDGWKPVAEFDQEVKAVSCPTERWCEVIGSAGARSWTLRGRQGSGGATGWRAEATPPPSPPGGSEILLNDVYCLSPGDCTVIGIYRRGGYRTYVAHWDGRGWAFEEAVDRYAGVSHGMLGLACPAVDDCIAVGGYLYKPLMEHWDGERWRLAPAPSPEGADEAYVVAISCSSPAACMGVGYVRLDEEVRPFAVRWDGGKWKTMPEPPPVSGGDTRLHSVSCVSGDECIAVGTLTEGSSTSARESAVTALWDGSGWTWLKTPHPQKFSSLAGVSCGPDAGCSAVGWAGSRSVWEDRPTSAPLALQLG